MDKTHQVLLHQQDVCKDLHPLSGAPEIQAVEEGCDLIVCVQLQIQAALLVTSLPLLCGGNPDRLIDQALEKRNGDHVRCNRSQTRDQNQGLTGFSSIPSHRHLRESFEVLSIDESTHVLSHHPMSLRGFPEVSSQSDSDHEEPALGNGREGRKKHGCMGWLKSGTLIREKKALEREETANLLDVVREFQEWTMRCDIVGEDQDGRTPQLPVPCIVQLEKEFSELMRNDGLPDVSPFLEGSFVGQPNEDQRESQERNQRIHCPRTINNKKRRGKPSDTHMT